MIFMRRTCVTRRYVVLSALMLLAVQSLAYAQRTLETRLTESSLFKNGLGFHTREARVPGAGEYMLGNLPVPVHGSFWILGERESTAVEEVVAFSSPRTRTTKALTLLELLRANVGKNVEVLTESDGWTAGTVAAAPEIEPALPYDQSGSSNDGGFYGYWRAPRAYRPPNAEPPGRQGRAEYVMLQTDRGTLALPPGEIKGVRGAPKADLAVDFDETHPGAALRVKVGGSGGTLRVGYLTWGMTWAPSYRIDVSDPKQAAVHCKAALLNDVEDLDGATVNFITGYPNLAFAEVPDPLALWGDVTSFLQSLMELGARSRRGRTPMVAQQVVMSNIAVGAYGGESPVAPQEGEVREDLFLYPRENVALGRGERAYYPLFVKKVPYEKIHLWEIEDSLDERGRWRYDWWYDQPDQRLDQEEVWHSVRLTNTAGIPWTTAPAMTVQEGRVLGQDTLYYTSAGEKALVKITRAVDVRATQGETEVERVRNAPTPYSREFDLITVKGEMRVFNHKNTPIKILIKKTLSGEVLSSSPEADVEPTTKGVWGVNPQHILTWELPVEAGGKEYLTYQYKVHARR